MTDMGTLLADFPDSRSSRPISAGGSRASSARVPRRQNAGSEGQRSWLRPRLRIGVKRRREIITGEFRSA
jgi:hypothetical protein